MSSNPWSSVMPGGVEFTRHDDEDDPWGEPSDAGQGDAVAPQPDQQTGQQAGVVSTPVDATPQPAVPATAPTVGALPVQSPAPVAPGLPVRPLPSVPPTVTPSLPVAAPAQVPAPAQAPVVSLPVAPAVPATGNTEGVDMTDTPAPGGDPVGGGALPSGEVPLPVVTLPDLPVVDLPVVDLPVGEGEPADPEEGAVAGGGSPSKTEGLYRLPVSPRGPRPAWLDENDEEEREGVNRDTAPAPVLAPDGATATVPAAEPEVEIVVEDGLRVDTTTGEVLDTPAPEAPAPAPPVAAPVPVLPTAPVAPVAPVVEIPVVELTPAEDQPKPAVVDVGEDFDLGDLLHGNSTDPEEVKAARASKAQAKKTKKATERAVALTDRDLTMLQFLARYRFATYPQLARYFGTTPVALRQRVPRLSKEGLLVRKTIGKSQHGVWLPTDAGMRTSGLDLPTPTLSWATAAHTLGLVDIGVMYELEGETVVTEREIRAADQRDRPSTRMRAAMVYAGVDPDEALEEDNPRLYVVNLGSGESHYGHIPDMVLVRPNAPDGSPASVAVELELVHKPATQWRKVLRAYERAPHIGEVIYYTNQKKIAAGIAKAAQEVGADHMVTVRRFHPSESSAIAQSSQ